MTKHDLHDFMSQLSVKMDAEYARIRKSSKHDAGTAGDEAEESWADLLRDWLPAAYQVVTHGQLLDSRGNLSPQIDVLVLKPSYPPSMHTKKKYLLAGVAAAFECKLTLRKSDLKSALENIATIKRMVPSASGTPYRELLTAPICGLLAHSHQIRRPKRGAATQAAVVSHLIHAADATAVQHPREMIDLVCVPGLATWVATKQPLSDREEELDPAIRSTLDPAGTPTTAYLCHAGDPEYPAGPDTPFSPLGVFLTELLVKLAWEDSSLRDIAGYFVDVEFSASADAMSRSWPRSIYSQALHKELTLKRLVDELAWNEWGCSIE